MKYESVVKVEPQGYCGGVRRAITLAKQAAQNAEKVTVLGDLVHNKFVIDELKKAGVDTVEAKGRPRYDLLDEIDSGTVIFTAHGVSGRVKKKAEEKGLTVVDASCPFVVSTQKKVQEKLDEDYVVFYIGKPGHPEAESVIDGRENVYLIAKEEDIPAVSEAKIFVTNQTTMSTLDIKDLFKAIEKRYPSAEFDDEICNATRIRQEAVLKLQDANVLIVVGDPSSNNTRQLEAIGKKAGIPRTFRIESKESLEELDVPAGSRIAVTSGASTPGWLVDEIIEELTK